MHNTKPLTIGKDPATELMPSRTYNSYPQVRQKIIDSTVVNPILVNPKIQDSTLINPVIVNDSPYRAPVRKRVIITHPW